MGQVGTASIEVIADTTTARQQLEELAELSSELQDVRIGRVGFSLGDAGVVASVLGFIGYLVHVFV